MLMDTWELPPIAPAGKESVVIKIVSIRTHIISTAAHAHLALLVARYVVCGMRIRHGR